MEKIKKSFIEREKRGSKSYRFYADTILGKTFKICK